MKLIIGLGNPGSAYADTRHSLGARVLESYAKSRGLVFKKHSANALVARTTIDGSRIIIALPQSYMNESGTVVAHLKKYFKIRTADTILVYDDLDLPFGTLRVSRNATSGGHNGVASVLQALTSDRFLRLRLGIGPKRGAADRFVLGRWNTGERATLPAIMETAGEALTLLVAKGLLGAANQYNKKSLS